MWKLAIIAVSVKNRDRKHNRKYELRQVAIGFEINYGGVKS